MYEISIILEEKAKISEIQGSNSFTRCGIFTTTKIGGTMMDKLMIFTTVLNRKVQGMPNRTDGEMMVLAWKVAHASVEGEREGKTGKKRGKENAG